MQLDPRVPIHWVSALATGFTVTLVLVIPADAKLSTINSMCLLVLNQFLHAKSIQDF